MRGVFIEAVFEYVTVFNRIIMFWKVEVENLNVKL